MADRESYIETAREAVLDTVHNFHFRVTTDDGDELEVPFEYQIAKPPYSPYRAAKGAPEEYQSELIRIIEDRRHASEELIINGVGAVRMIAQQNGLGGDCSNFAYRGTDLIHVRMDLKPYEQTVYRTGDDIRDFHATMKPSWDAKDSSGNVRELTADEKLKLETADLIEVAWLMEVFGKDPTFVTGSAHICSPHSTVEVQANETLPGDQVAFKEVGKTVVSHVAVVEAVEIDDNQVHTDFWHAWPSGDLTDPGFRRDHVTIERGNATWSHPGLANRYQSFSFLRPLEMYRAYSSLS